MDATTVSIIQYGALGLLLLILFGLYRLASWALANLLAPALRTFLEHVGEIKKSIDAQTSALKMSIDVQTQVLTQMRIEDAERHGEMQQCIEKSAKETRHDVRGALVSIGLRDRDDDASALGRKTLKENP